MRREYINNIDNELRVLLSRRGMALHPPPPPLPLTHFLVSSPPVLACLKNFWTCSDEPNGHPQCVREVVVYFIIHHATVPKELLEMMLEDMVGIGKIDSILSRQTEPGVFMASA